MRRRSCRRNVPIPFHPSDFDLSQLRNLSREEGKRESFEACDFTVVAPGGLKTLGEGDVEDVVVVMGQGEWELAFGS